jgi:hypothetical protein
LKYQPDKKIIFVFLVLTLVSSVSTSTFVTGNNNVNLVFAKKHNSSSNSGGVDKSSGDKSSTDNSDVGTTMGGNDDSNSGGSGSDSGSSGNSGGSATSPLSISNRGNFPATTIDNTPTSPKMCSDGSPPASDGSCPSPTALPPASPAVDCNATPNDPTCHTTTTTAPAEQNFAPNTLTQPRCPLLPIDANGNCPRIDMQGGGLGLPPLVGSQEKQQAHYNLPYDAWRAKQLPDGSCPADYHYNSNSTTGQYCILNIHLKNPDGSCPVGTIMTTTNVCVKMPVLPGTSTGSGGGFIQMFPTSPPTSPPATPPTDTTPPPPPSTK